MKQQHLSLPLATKLRPKNLTEFVGQTHLLAPGKPLERMLAQKHLYSLILWGPPGTGKTTLAHLLAESVGAHWVALSAVMSGVKEVREVVKDAEELLEETGQVTVLFMDEVHRFNKAQQDAFLPHIEAGKIIFIGATTENPSFHLNNALLSRARVYVLKSLTAIELELILQRALTQLPGGAARGWAIEENAKKLLLQVADGDARQMLILLEWAADFVGAEIVPAVITESTIQQLSQHTWRRFDKGGDAFYDQISALHKSVRGSDPDAALYWLVRMFDGGCDPYYIARRVIRMANEDIGNADPRGLTIALEAWQAYERLGSPEGELAIAQAVIYLACAPKSNAVYVAYKAVQQDVEQYGTLPVPLYLCNAPTQLMKSLDYQKGYRYAHDEPDAFAAGVHYFPESMPQRQYYQPTPRGLEIKIKERLDQLRQLNLQKRKS